MPTIQLDCQVPILDVDSSQLYERRADFLHQRNLLESPICRLPAELFSRIISHSIIPIQYDWKDRPITISNAKDLFRVGSVCSHWYHATQFDTQFWSTFTLRDIVDDADESMPDYVSLLRHYYKHVGAAGLSVWIYDMHMPLRPGDMLHRIFQIILEENAGKLRSFHVWDFYPAEYACCISPSIFEYAQREVQFTQLVELEFCWTLKILNSPCVLFRNSPLLQKLSLDIPGYSMLPTTLNFPWSRITTVKFCHTNLEHALVLLSSHPHFTEFSFEMYFDKHHTEHTWSPPSHVLFDMQLTTKFGWRIRCFRFPNLRHLVWSATAPSDHPSTQSFFAAMQQLEHLEFYPLPRSCISQYFDLFENLKTLDVVLGLDATFNQQWLKKLIITPGNGNLLPHLRGLKIISSSNDTPCSAVIVILYSRCIGPIPRSSLEVDLDRLTFPPYVRSTAQRERRGHLFEFSFHRKVPGVFEKVDWASSSHYGALENLISQAKEVYGGLDLPEIKLVFEN